MATPNNSKANLSKSQAMEDFAADDRIPETAQTMSPAFRPAYKDIDFLLRDELRPLRLQLELLKPELLQQEAGIESTIVVFGSTRIPEPEIASKNLQEVERLLSKNPSDRELRRRASIAKRLNNKSKYYEMSREFGRLVTSECQSAEICNSVIVTGSGHGIMEAANRGAYEAGGKSIGLNIVLPEEQYPNKYVTPELCFQFQYFALRKMHFLMRAKALVVFPGGYGTLDELFETLTLIQTRKVSPLPVLLFGKEYWDTIVNFEALVDEGMIAQQDADSFRFVESPAEAWELINEFYS